LTNELDDLAVRISRGGSPTLVSRKLATTRRLICASPHYVAHHGTPASPEDLKGHACIAYTYSDSADEWRLLDETGKEHSVAVPQRMQTNNGDTARAAALAGLGIIRQPTFLIGEDVREGRLVPLLTGYRMSEIDILAAYPSRRHLSAKVRVMVDFLVESFRGTPPWDRKS
jgi:DNA-binding transcriptional LysR family regulator